MCQSTICFNIISLTTQYSQNEGRSWQVRSPMQDLGAGPLWAVVLWRHRVQSTLLYDHGRAQI